MDGGDGDAKELGDFFGGHAAEDAEFDDGGLAFVNSREAFEGFIDVAEGEIFCCGWFGRVSKINQRIFASALVCAALFSVGDKDAAHHLRGHAEDVGAVAEVYAVLGEQAEIGLVYQSGGLQGVAFPLAAHVGRRDLMELRIDLRHDLV